MIENAPPKFKIKNPLTNKDIWFRPFLVKEEKKLLMISQLGNKEEIINCVKEIIDSCFENINSKNLPTYVTDYLFNNIRMKSVGEKIDSKFICPYTEELIDLNFSLSDIQIKRKENISNKIKIDDSITVLLREPSYEDISSLNPNEIEYENIIDLAARCLIKIYSNNEVIDLNIDDYQKNKDFLLNMTTKQFNKIIEFFENLPTYEYEYKYETSDGERRSITISGIEDFFMFASAT
jgi:hypothetical protein